MINWWRRGALSVLGMVLASLSVGEAASYTAASQRAGLSLPEGSALVLFAPYRTARDFQELGLPQAVSGALADVSGRQEAWRAAVVTGDRVLSILTTAPPVSNGKLLPSVVIVRGIDKP